MTGGSDVVGIDRRTESRSDLETAVATPAPVSKHQEDSQDADNQYDRTDQSRF
jgi:hypothetical protein